MDKYDILEQEKIPTSRTNYVGIEIEFISESDDDDIRETLIDLGLQYNCNLTDDGSIDPTQPLTEKEKAKIRELKAELDEAYTAAQVHRVAYFASGMKPQSVQDKLQQAYTKANNVVYNLKCKIDEIESSVEEFNPHELRVLCPENELKATLKTLEQLFSKHKCWVNDTCGLHVHLDMRSRDAKKCYKLLTDKEDQMLSMVPAVRRKSTYCKKSKGFASEDRYSIVNSAAYKKLGTLEVRIKDGTVNMAEIYNWTTYLTSIINEKTFTKGTKQYVKRTIAKHKTA